VAIAQRQGAPKLGGEGISTVIGPEIQVIGRIEGGEELRIQGYVEGTIHLSEALIVEATGVVVADVRARDVVIAGIIVGDVLAGGRVVLQAGARVVGNITAPRVSIAAGAALRGQVSMGDTGDDGPAEGSTGGRSSLGRWRGGGSSTSGGGGRAPARGVIPKVTRTPGRSAAAPAVQRATARAQERDESARLPPRRLPPREQSLVPAALEEPRVEDDLDVDNDEGAEDEELIEVSEDGTVTTRHGKKQAARPRLPVRGKHIVEHR